MASALTALLRQRYSDRLVALMLEGSVAKGLDAPCSDLELGVVVEGAEDRWYPFVRQGMFIGMSYSSPESGLAEAARIAYTWPVASDSLSHGIALYDPSGLYPKLREIRGQAEAAADFGMLIREALADMYENVLKLCALEPSQGLEAAFFAGQASYWAAIAVALAQQHRYLSTRRMIEESSTLKSLPVGFQRSIESLLGADADVLERK